MGGKMETSSEPKHAKGSQEHTKVLEKIGEYEVAYKLILMEWSVSKNLGGTGYDLYISKGEKKYRLEVKTRDKIHSSQKDSSAHFILSAKEMTSFDFLVCYWYGEKTKDGKNVFFIIPSKEMPENGRFTARKDKRNEGTFLNEKWLNKWDYFKG
jgi:hypothetical protein